MRTESKSLTTLCAIKQFSKLTADGVSIIILKIQCETSSQIKTKIQ